MAWPLSSVHICLNENVPKTSMFWKGLSSVPLSFFTNCPENLYLFQGIVLKTYMFDLIEQRRICG